MAKMFYTAEEAAEKLGKTTEELMEMASRGELQTFKQDDQDMFRVEQINMLAEDDDLGDLSISIVVECPPEGNPADLDDDGLVDGADLGLLLSGWGPCTTPPCPSDLNDDGLTDGADLGLLLAQFGWTAG